jgi:hypothetical protein
MEEPTGILQQRRIEANVIRAFLAVLTREIGMERARALVAEVVRGMAFDKGRELRRMHAAGDLAALVDLWKNLSKGGALDIDFIEESKDCLHLRVNRCGYADMYRSMGMDDSLGSILSCDRDDPLLKGYSDQISLERTRCILQEADFCELIYRAKK